MSYGTMYRYRMMAKAQEYYASTEFAKMAKLESIAESRAEADLIAAYPEGINTTNAAEVLDFQRERIIARKTELGL